MTDSNVPEETAGGPLGKLAGKAKETAGAILGDEELAREGRLQQAQAEAEAEATQAEAEARLREAETEVEAAGANNELERERLKAELAAEEREAAIDRDQQDRVSDAACAPSRRRRTRSASAVSRRRPHQGPSGKQKPSGWPSNRRLLAWRRKHAAQKRERIRSTPRRPHEPAHDFPISGRRLRQVADDFRGMRHSPRAPERIIPAGRLPWTASKHGCAASPAERCETTNSCETPNGGDWPRTNAPAPAACGQTHRGDPSTLTSGSRTA